MNIQKHIKIYGNVQGVGYRYWLQSFALEYEIYGWVKNNVEGEVEAVLIGEEDSSVGRAGLFDVSGIGAGCEFIGVVESDSLGVDSSTLGDGEDCVMAWRSC